MEWPPEKKAIDIGSFYADSSKFTGTTGWTPSVALREGLRRTVAFYREHWAQYVDAPSRRPQERRVTRDRAHSVHVAGAGRRCAPTSGPRSIA